MKKNTVFFTVFSVCVLISTHALGKDLDEDGLDDDWEIRYFGVLSVQKSTDDFDGDELKNNQEYNTGTNPSLKDTDFDGLNDKQESQYFTNPLVADTDRDSLLDGDEIFYGTNPLNKDTDADGAQDGLEINVYHTNPLEEDSDSGGVLDGDEIENGTNPRDNPDDDAGLVDLDADADGIPSRIEKTLQLCNAGGTDLISRDLDPDSDNDGINDGIEDTNLNGVYEKDTNNNLRYDYAQYDIVGFQISESEETDPCNPDTDADGLSDVLDKRFADPYVQDTDGDGLNDGEEYTYKDTYACLDLREVDSDKDKISDAQEIKTYETNPCLKDTDGDLIYDIFELFVDSTDPKDALSVKTNSDVLDGISDAFESTVSHTDPNNKDTDNDGLLDGDEISVASFVSLSDPLDPDTDDDGVLDGVDIDPSKQDADGDGLDDALEYGLVGVDSCPLTVTNMSSADSDGDGLSDFLEDANANGCVEPNETDPNKKDTDDDGIDDGWELYEESGDGCVFSPVNGLDGQEDPDNDGATNRVEFEQKTKPCDPDTDDDGILDGVEIDAGWAPRRDDTDEDHLKDGQEDLNHDGIVESGESDPLLLDTDNDTLSDVQEVLFLGTNPSSVDTDLDGLTDDKEVRFYATDPLVADTDVDGLNDGLELGIEGIDLDPSSVTFVKKQDTDADSLKDGEEDTNYNGRVDEGETDPLQYDTDHDAVSDGKEIGIGTDPLNPDSDNDGLTDGVEYYVLNTDPKDPSSMPLVDSDGDGWGDESELLYGSDPFDRDSDDDGITDYEEVTSLNNQNMSNGEYDGAFVDTDGDGVPNYRDADSDNDTWQDVEEFRRNPLTGKAADSDSDGVPDYLDLNSDEGRTSDKVERIQETDPTDSSDDGKGWLEENGFVRGRGCQSYQTLDVVWVWMVCLWVLTRLRVGKPQHHPVI